MKAIGRTSFNVNIYKGVTRNHLIILGVSLLAAGGILLLQSFRYSASIPSLLEAGGQLWWEPLSMMLRSLAIWAFVLGVVFAIQLIDQPTARYGKQFWAALVTGFVLGLLLPFLLVLAIGVWIFIPLGLLSLFIPQITQYATLQFAWLAAAYLVFIWIVVGMPPLLIGIFRERRWYFMLVVLLLFFQLLLDVLQVLVGAMQIILKNSLWLTNNTAFALAIFGSLVLTIVAVLVSLWGQPVLTIVYAITGIYVASVVTGNFSDLLFHWGEIPSAILALLSPLVYLQLAKWVLRSEGAAVACLAAGFAGLLAGLFVAQLFHLGITGQSWFSLLVGILITLGLGLALGFLLGRRVTRLLSGRLRLLPVVARYIDAGMIAGIMAGLLVGGFLAR